MAFRFTSFIAFGCLLLLTASVQGAAIDNAVTPRIHSSDELISTIVDKCFHANAMHCLKEKVLTYLDTVANVEEEVSGRAFDDDVIDKVIVDRLGRILRSNEVRVQLPETFFASSVVTYRADRGFDLELPKEEGGCNSLLTHSVLGILSTFILSNQKVVPRRRTRTSSSCPCCCS